MVDIQRQAEEIGSNPLPDEELSQMVFKNQTAYNVGLGTRKKPTSSRRTIDSSPSRLHLQEQLDSTKEELDSTKKELKQTQEKLQQVEEDNRKKMEEFNEQMRTFRQMLEASLGQSASASTPPPSQSQWLLFFFYLYKHSVINF